MKKICGMTDLEAVTINGGQLRFMKKQTEELCLAAVRQNGNSLIYVKRQTYEICLAAVTQNFKVLGFVNEELRAFVDEAMMDI